MLHTRAKTLSTTEKSDVDHPVHVVQDLWPGTVNADDLQELYVQFHRCNTVLLELHQVRSSRLKLRQLTNEVFEESLDFL